MLLLADLASLITQYIWFLDAVSVVDGRPGTVLVVDTEGLFWAGCGLFDSQKPGTINFFTCMCMYSAIQREAGEERQVWRYSHRSGLDQPGP